MIGFNYIAKATEMHNCECLLLVGPTFAVIKHFQFQTFICISLYEYINSLHPMNFCRSNEYDSWIE